MFLIKTTVQFALAIIQWNLVAEGIHNGASVTQTTDATGTPDTQLNTQHRNGFWSRLTYGKQVWNQANTWQIYGEYFALGGLAVDSSGWAALVCVDGVLAQPTCLQLIRTSNLRTIS